MLKAAGGRKAQIAGAKAKYLAAAAAHAVSVAAAMNHEGDDVAIFTEKKKRKRKSENVDASTSNGEEETGTDRQKVNVDGGKKKKKKQEKEKGKGKEKVKVKAKKEKVEKVVVVVDKAGDKFRTAKDIVVTGRAASHTNDDDGGVGEANYSAPSPAYTFDDTPFCNELVAALKSAEGFVKPTAVQAQAWAVAAEGRDVVCLAKTGSGKTLSFLLPTLQNIRRTIDAPTRATVGGSGWLPAPVALILAPTRELAMQIQAEAVQFGKPLGIRSVCVFGGVAVHQQLNSLKGGANAYPHIIVATPGRLYVSMAVSFVQRAFWRVQ